MKYMVLSRIYSISNQKTFEAGEIVEISGDARDLVENGFLEPAVEDEKVEPQPEEGEVDNG